MSMLRYDVMYYDVMMINIQLPTYFLFSWKGGLTASK